MRVRITLAAGLVAIAIAVAVALAHSPAVLAGTNGVAPEAVMAITRGGSVACQSREALPANTSALRLWVGVNVGPEVKVAVLSGARVITRGMQEAGWTGAVVTVPVRPLRAAFAHVRVCFKFGPATEEIWLVGAQTPAGQGGLLGATVNGRANSGRTLPRKMTIEYLRPGDRSWWSRALSIAGRIGAGRAPGGGWVGLLPLVLMVMAAALAAGLILRRLGRRWPVAVAPIAGGAPTAPPPPVEPEPAARREAALLGADARGSGARHRPEAARGARAIRGLRAGLRRGPAAAWACAGVAFLSAAAWSLITPPFQVPDEPSHYAYVGLLAEGPRLPNPNGPDYSPQEAAILEDLNHESIRFNPAIGATLTRGQQQLLRHDLAAPLSRRGGGGAGVASNQPPLYYALETIPYYLGSGGTLLGMLELMRLLSALMASLGALFAYLFLREALPRFPWAWTVGGLTLALAPLPGFMSGAVNPDSMLMAVSAATFFCLARAFRRGLTRRLAIVIGLVITVGLLTKLNYVGLVPGVVLALVLLAHRAARVWGRGVAYRSLAVALAIPATPAGLYVLANALSNHHTLGLLSSAIGLTSHHGTPLGELVYAWEYFLPRLPGMANDFPGLFPLRQIWFDRSVGLYGWLDTYFPDWVYKFALIPVGLIAVLGLRALISSRAALRERAGELIAYAVISLGVLALIGADAYLEFPGRSGAYSEPRYLLPMATLFAAICALAARGAGRRWGPAVGTLIVLLILAHDIFSQLLTVGRYYG